MNMIGVYGEVGTTPPTAKRIYLINTIPHSTPQ